MRRRRPDPEEPPAPGTARLVALRLLGRRDYTTAELRHRLTDRGYTSDVIDDTLARLRSEGLQDDDRAAAAHVRTASRIKGRGPLRIRRELEARGIAKTTIEASTAAFTKEEVRAALGRFLARKGVTSPLPAADRQRLFQHLLRRGFPADAIAAALRMPAPPEEDE